MILDYLSEIYAELEERIDNIRALADVNEELVAIAINNLRSLRTDVIATGRNQGILAKIDHQLEMYKQVAQIPQLTTKFPIIREQSVVLIIGTLEVFATDVMKAVGNNDPKLYVWNDPKEKILVEPALISDEFTLGDAILSHLKLRGVSFQDLQSLLRTFETYLSVTIDVDKTDRDALVIGAAYRNVIVHNRSVVDRGFLKQIRGTTYFSAFESKNGENIKIDDDFVDALSLATRNLAAKIAGELIEHAD